MVRLPPGASEGYVKNAGSRPGRTTVNVSKFCGTRMHVASPAAITTARDNRSSR